jgi:hypothetical protein
MRLRAMVPNGSLPADVPRSAHGTAAPDPDGVSTAIRAGGRGFAACGRGLLAAAPPRSVRMSSRFVAPLFPR